MSIEEIECLIEETEAALKTGNYNDGERLARQIIEALTPKIGEADLYDSQKRLVLLARGLRHLSDSFWRRGIVHQALPYALSAVSTAVESENRIEEALSLNNLGVVYAIQTDYSQALDCLQHSFDIYHELGRKAEWAGILLHIGNVKNALSDNQGALECYWLTFEVFTELDMKVKASIAMASIGNIYLSLSEFLPALQHTQHALELFLDLGMKRESSVALGTIGILYYELADYQRAFEYMSRSLIAYEETDNKRGIALMTGNIGNTYNALKDYPQALVFLQKSVSECRKIGDEKQLANTLRNLGNTYTNLLNFSEAQECFTEALSINKGIDDKKSTANLYISIGNLHIKSTDFSRTSEINTQSLPAQNETSNQKVIPTITKNNYPSNSNKDDLKTDIKMAEEYFLQAVMIFDELGSKRSLFDAYNLLSNLYKSQHRWEEYSEYIEKYQELYIEVQNEEVKKQADKFGWERKIADMEKEKEIEAIKTEANKKLLEQTIELQTVKIEAKIREVKSNVEELVKKNNFLHQIRTDLERVEPFTRQHGREIIEQILDRITRNIKSFENIGSIKQQWEDVHGKFIRQLHEVYPKLTPMELKISALLKMNLTSSNITSIVFLSKRTVEFHRYNIRKKMNLPRKTDLNVLFNEMFSE